MTNESVLRQLLASRHNPSSEDNENFVPAVAESEWLQEGAEDLRRDIEQSKDNQPPRPGKKPRAPRKHRLRKCAKRSDGKRDRKGDWQATEVARRRVQEQQGQEEEEFVVGEALGGYGWFFLISSLHSFVIALMTDLFSDVLTLATPTR